VERIAATMVAEEVAVHVIPGKPVTARSNVCLFSVRLTAAEKIVATMDAVEAAVHAIQGKPVTARSNVYLLLLVAERTFRKSVPRLVSVKECTPVPMTAGTAAEACATAATATSVDVSDAQITNHERVSKRTEDGNMN